MQHMQQILQWLEEKNPLLALSLCGALKEKEFHFPKVSFPLPSGAEVIYIYKVQRCFEIIAPFLESGGKVVFVEGERERLIAFLHLKEFIPHKNLSIIAPEESQYQKIALENVFKKAVFIGSLDPLKEWIDGVHMSFSEYRLFGEEILPNMQANLLHADPFIDGRSLEGVYRGVPAVIAAGGPSLEDSFTALRELPGKALIFGVGSAIPRLQEEGIAFDYGVCIDPNPPLQKGSFPLFYQGRVSSKLFREHTGEKIWMGTSSSWPIEAWLYRESGIEPWEFPTGWNAGTFAVEIASFLGCDPIIVLGMDGGERPDLKRGVEWVENMSHVIRGEKGLSKIQGQKVPRISFVESTLDKEKILHNLRILNDPSLQEEIADYLEAPEERKKLLLEITLLEHPLYTHFLEPLWKLFRPLYTQENEFVSALLFYQKALAWQDKGAFVKEERGLDLKIPEIFFLKHALGEIKEEEIEYQKLKALTLPQEIETVYLFGYSPFISPLLHWAQEDKNREVIILENRASVLLQLEKERLEKPFLAKNIHFRFWPLEMELHEFAESLVLEFPFGKPHFISLHSDIALSEKLKREILRKTTLTDAIHTEMLQYHKLFSNLIANFKRLPKAFTIADWKGHFSDVPCVICGAGPSLKEATSLFREEEKFLLFAAGSAIAALNTMDVKPHLLFAVDPNPEEFTRLASHTSRDVPLVFAPRLEKRVVEMHTGPLGFFPTGTGGAIEDYLVEKLKFTDPKILENLGEEGLSVTCVALMTALYLGCNPIIFAGVDLSFSDGKRYAEGIPGNAEILEPRLEEDGKETLTRWIMERDTIKDVIKKYPHHKFYRISQEGLPIEGVDLLDQSAFFKYASQDFRKRLSEKVFSSEMTVTSQEIDQILFELKESFEEAHLLVQKIQEEPLRAPVLIMDLEETLAFKLALKGSSFVLSHCITRKLEGKEAEQELYKNLQGVIEGFLQCF